MIYPSRDDYEAREQRERAQRAAAEVGHLARWRDAYWATGICTRRIERSDPVRVSCEICEHAEWLHPGFTNPDPDLTGCLACHVKQQAGARPSGRPPEPRYLT